MNIYFLRRFTMKNSTLIAFLFFTSLVAALPAKALEAQFTNLSRAGSTASNIGPMIEYTVTYQLSAIPNVAVTAISTQGDLLTLPVTLQGSYPLGNDDGQGAFGGTGTISVFAIDTSALCATGNLYILRATSTVPAPDVVAETSRLVQCNQ
jgi:hypothetical protein